MRNRPHSRGLDGEIRVENGRKNKESEVCVAEGAVGGSHGSRDDGGPERQTKRKTGSRKGHRPRKSR